MKTLQKFASTHANVQNHLSLERHQIDRETYHKGYIVAPAEWQVLASQAAALKNQHSQPELGAKRQANKEMNGRPKLENGERSWE